MKTKKMANLKDPHRNVHVTFTPSADQLYEIETWLINEDKKGRGFYCNWNIIKKSYSEKRMALILVENKSIGFVTWCVFEYSATICIAEIQPSYRKKGYGEVLIKELFNFFIKKNILVVQLHCRPPESEKIWKRLGFIEFPKTPSFNRFNNPDDKHLYKILVPSMNQDYSTESDEIIELWDKEPLMITNEQSTWRWHISFKNNSRMLSMPIIFPSAADWRIKYSKGSLAIIDDKVKYWGTDIHHLNFIIITSIPDK